MVKSYVAVPEFITVHLGPPDSAAENVTVSFPEYIKNVASSEIYPTWPENAIRANVYAQVTFALNRIYTEWYPAMGYDFDITNNTAFDQSFVQGRNIYEIFNHQIAYEIRLQQAMEENFLCPFHYFGISDVSLVDEKQIKAKKM